jgi:glycosyltransferase involved in cell wall biosynthesis
VKILVVAPSMPPDLWSGSGRAVADLVQMARKRREVRLVAGFRNSRAKIPPEAIAIDLRRLGPVAARARLAQAALREARRFRPDLVLSATVSLPPMGCPVACLAHDLAPSDDPDWEERVRWAAYARMASRMDLMITTSNASAARLSELGVPGERIRVVPPGVDTVRFAPVDKGEPDPEAPVHFVHAGRILPAKGQHLALDAVARLPRFHKRRARLTIAGSVGDPVYLDRLRVQGWEQPVEFRLDVHSMAAVLQQADVVLLPSIVEMGYCTTVVEAMAVGLPVIWFDQPAVREASGGIGLPVPAEDIRAMRAAMVRLMDDPEERRRVGAAGRRFVVGNLSRERTWEHYAAVLDALV